MVEWNPLFADSIAAIESGGNYNLLGPVTKSGDRAYGKYQVMGSNVPSWTQEALGNKLTPAEFRADPQAQDAVFQHRFGLYVNKYGPEGAARAWFAGEGGMNDPNRQDQLGTSVESYGKRFMAGLQPQAQPPVSPPVGAPTPPAAQANANPMGQLSPEVFNAIAQQSGLLAQPKAPALSAPTPPPPPPQAPNPLLNMAQLQQFNRPQWIKLF